MPGSGPSTSWPGSARAPEFGSPTSSAVNRATPNAPPFPMGQAVQPVLEAMGGNALAVLLTQKLLGAKQF